MLLDRQQAVAEALVVLHQVEVADPAPQVICTPARENASGSGKVPVEKAVTSTQSVQVFSSHKPGIRIGK